MIEDANFQVAQAVSKIELERKLKAERKRVIEEVRKIIKEEIDGHCSIEARLNKLDAGVE